MTPAHNTPRTRGAGTKVDLQPDLARRHLLLSFPNLEGSESGSEAVDRLVEGAVHHLLRGKSTSTILAVTEVVAAIKTMAGLEYESAEIIASLERLSVGGHLEFKHAEKRAFVFKERRYRELCTDHDYREERLGAVRAEWFDDLRLRHQLDDAQLADLWTALEVFIAQLMNTFAAEAASFLYQSDEGGDARFAAVVDQRLPQVADVVRAELLPIAQVELPRFLDSKSAARTDYLVHRLRAAFIFHLLSIDPGASALMRENVSDKLLYLDTNVLFRLFGFDGPTLAYGPQMVVSISRALNCRLVVAEETVHEFLRRLRWEMVQIKRHPINHETYRRLVAEHPGDEYSFMRAYYQEYLGGRVQTADEFERKYENVERILGQYGIEIDSKAELTDEDEAAEDFRDLHSGINTWTQGKRPPESVAHDAFMLRLIRQLRGRRDKTAGSVKVWLLTYDRSLTSFSVRRAKVDQLPACLLASDWLQIARPFLPRTDDYDQSFIAMLRYPVAFEDPAVVPLEQMVEALHRLDGMQDIPTPVIAAMVSDREIVRRIQRSRGDDEIKQLVEVEAATYARSIETSLARAEQENKILAERVEQLAFTSEEHRKKVEMAGNIALATTQQRDEAMRELERARREADERVAAAVRAVQEAADGRTNAAVDEAVRETEKRVRTEFSVRVRRGLSVAGGLALIVLAAVVEWKIPAARTTIGLMVTAAWVVLGGYALVILAKRGRVGDSLSRSADISGLIGFVVLTLQALGIIRPDTNPVSPANQSSVSPSVTGDSARLAGRRAATQPDSSNTLRSGSAIAVPSAHDSSVGSSPVSTAHDRD